MYVHIIVVGGVAWLVITVGGAIIIMYVCSTTGGCACANINSHY